MRQESLYDICRYAVSRLKWLEQSPVGYIKVLTQVCRRIETTRLYNGLVVVA